MEVQDEVKTLAMDLQGEINALIGHTIRFVLAYDENEGCEVCKDFVEKVEPIVRKIIRITGRLEKLSKQTVKGVLPTATGGGE